jgi:hypothetical protein
MKELQAQQASYQRDAGKLRGGMAAAATAVEAVRSSRHGLMEAAMLEQVGRVVCCSVLCSTWQCLMGSCCRLACPWASCYTSTLPVATLICQASMCSCVPVGAPAGPSFYPQASNIVLRLPAGAESYLLATHGLDG